MRGGCAALILASASLASVSSASAQFRIAEDRGGQIGPYLQQYAMVRDSGSRVVIDGACLSACTLVLGTVPKERICVTPRANLGFHAAWNLAPGGRAVYSAEGTRLLWDLYPAPVRRWIQGKGGLTPKMIYLQGRELESLYPACSEPVRSASRGRTRAAKTNKGRTLYAASSGAM